METACAASESWSGTYYELAIEISRAPVDERLRCAIERLWSCDAVVGGPWPDKTETHNVVISPLPAAEEMVASYGMLRVANLGDLRCVAWIIREVERGSDWLDLCIPTSALEPFGLVYPLVSETPCELIRKVDRALLDVAINVYAGVAFELGLVGEEVSGMWSSATIVPDDISQGGFVLPEALAQRLGAFTLSLPIAPSLYWIENRCEEPFEKIGEL